VSQNQGPNSATIRPRALADIEHHADYLEENATPEVALRFRTAIMQAVDTIGTMPGVGSPQEIRNPYLSTLRMWVVPGFRNYLLFYVTPEGNTEIVRLLHAAQDRLSILEDEA
jgi:toxin ParE1/3/4